MDKLMMNKLDDMELDMVAGGAPKKNCYDGDYSTLPFGNLSKKMVDGIESGVKAVGNGVKAVGNAFDRMLYKVFGPPRKR